MDSNHIGPERARSKSRTLKLLIVAAILGGSLAAGAAPAGAAVWRPFSATSPWNIPAAQKGSITSSNPYGSQFTSYTSSLELSGVAPDNQWAKPIFFAKAGDPEYRWTDTNGWPKGDIRYGGEPIPMPAGAKQATGSDGHLTIVTADRRYAYDMWRANVSTRSAEAIVRFDLAGSGVPGVQTSNTSARGSGTPIIPTTIRAEEAVSGIEHALGLTVPRVASSYIWPATHSDGSSGSIKYGMLFVLRADFPVPANAEPRGAQHHRRAEELRGVRGRPGRLDGPGRRLHPRRPLVAGRHARRREHADPRGGLAAGERGLGAVPGARRPHRLRLRHRRRRLRRPAGSGAPAEPGARHQSGTGTGGAKKCTRRRARQGKCTRATSASKKQRARKRRA